MDNNIFDFKGNKVFFVSPHLDDAILSCGELIYSLHKKTNLTVINVFTDYGRGQQTLSAKMHLKYSGYAKLKDLYDQRIKEDKKAFGSLKAKVINLNEKEALWRECKNITSLESIFSKFFPEFKFIYPTYKFHISKAKISENDEETINRLSEKLKKIIPENSIVFCPIGVGGHVDHLVVKEAVIKNINPIFWLDQPYAKNGADRKFILTNYNEIKTVRSTIIKKSLIKYYESQIGLFKGKVIPSLNEKYFQEKDKTYKFSIEEYINKKEIDDWKILWQNSSTSHYFNSYDWYKTIKKVYTNTKVYVATLRQNGQLIAVLTLSKEKLYGVTVLKNPGGKFIDRSSLLTESNDRKVLEIFLKNLSSQNNVLLNEVTEDIESTLKNTRNINFLNSNVNYTLPFENNPFRFMQKEDRRKIRKVMKEHPNMFNLVMARGDLKLLDTAIKIDSKSYRDRKNIATFKNKIDRKFFEEIIKNNPKSAGINILYFRNKPIAYEIGIRAKGVYYGLNKSFDYKFRKLTPGKIIAYLLFEGLHKEGIKAFDFARGKDMLKKSFTKIEKKQYDAYIFNSKIKETWITSIKKAREQIVNNTFLYSTYRKAISLIT